MREMYSAFFALAALSPSRQRALRKAVAFHVVVLLGCAGWASSHPHQAAHVLGYVLLTMGMVEGACTRGLALTQVPKSQALEFLLVSPMKPAGVFLAEASVGLGLLALVTLSGLPVLVLMVENGHIQFIDVVPFLVMPYTWGTVAGMGLTAWAYEQLFIRRWGEKIVLSSVVIYLVIGAWRRAPGALDWLVAGIAGSVRAKQRRALSPLQSVRRGQVLVGRGFFQQLGSNVGARNRCGLVRNIASGPVRVQASRTFSGSSLPACHTQWATAPAVVPRNGR